MSGIGEFCSKYPPPRVLESAGDRDLDTDWIMLGGDAVPLGKSACWCTVCHDNLATEIAPIRSVYVTDLSAPMCAECAQPWRGDAVIPWQVGPVDPESCCLM